MEKKSFLDRLATPLGFVIILGVGLLVLAIAQATVRLPPTPPAAARPSASKTPSPTPTPSPKSSPTPTPTPTPEPPEVVWPQGQILIATDCPEGWCIRAFDPSTTRQETIAAFPAAPHQLQRQPQSAARLRGLHDPTFERALHINNFGGFTFGWVDRAGNVTDLFDKLPISEFSGGGHSVREVRFDADGNFWGIIANPDGRTGKMYKVERGSTTPVEAEWPDPTESRTCGIAHDRHENQCVGIAGQRGDPQWVAVMDAYRPGQEIIDGIDRTTEMLAIRGRPITEKTTRRPQMPLFSPDGTKIAFLAMGDGEQDMWLIEGETAPRKVASLSDNLQTYVGLIEWRDAPSA